MCYNIYAWISDILDTFLYLYNADYSILVYKQRQYMHNYIFPIIYIFELLYRISNNIRNNKRIFMVY